MRDSLIALQEKRLRRTVELCALAHPYYRRKFREWGVRPGDIRTLGDLAALPLTHKEDYMADPEAFRLEAGALPPEVSAEERTLWDVAYTTGTTTGRPSPFYNTTHDIYAVLDQARRCNEAEGLVPGDRIANLYPLAGFPTGAFLSVVRSGMIGGMPVVHGLTGSATSEFRVRNSLSEALRIVEGFRPTVLWGVPGFVRRFLYEAERRSADLSAVRLVLTSGEPVSGAMRKEIKGLLAGAGAAAPRVLARYAFTEMQGGLVQCAEEADPQNVVPDLYFLEAVEAGTGRRLPEGERGLLAVTHLHRRGTVVLRYAVGDVAAIAREPCPHCGREGERVVATPRRVGRLVKCRGMLVNADVILDVLSGMEEVEEFQVVFDRADRPGAMDELRIRVEAGSRTEPEGGSPEGSRRGGRLRKEIVRRVREAVSIRPEVEFVERGAISAESQSIKVRRVVDLRPPAD